MGKYLGNECWTMLGVVTIVVCLLMARLELAKVTPWLDTVPIRESFQSVVKRFLNAFKIVKKVRLQLNSNVPAPWLKFTTRQYKTSWYCLKTVRRKVLKFESRKCLEYTLMVFKR